MPNIGYGNARITRHMLPNGFRKILIRNEKVIFSSSLVLLPVITFQLTIWKFLYRIVFAIYNFLQRFLRTWICC